jgi:hypothetical protein
MSDAYPCPRQVNAAGMLEESIPATRGELPLHLSASICVCCGSLCASAVPIARFRPAVSRLEDCNRSPGNGLFRIRIADKYTNAKFDAATPTLYDQASCSQIHCNYQRNGCRGKPPSSMAPFANCHRRLPQKGFRPSSAWPTPTQDSYAVRSLQAADPMLRPVTRRTPWQRQSLLDRRSIPVQ